MFARQAPSALGAGAQKKTCKTVTKKVHGKKKTVKVCTTVKAKPAATKTPLPTATSIPTSTPTPTNTPVPVALDAMSFRLDASSFLSGSTVQTDQVESNDATTSALFAHFGTPTFADEGRQTGYYMVTDQLYGGHPVFVMYLVSIFGARAQAVAAYAQQKSGFDTLSGIPSEYVSSVTPPTGIGENIASYVSSSMTSSGNVLDSAETFFTRGRVMVEAGTFFYADDLDPYGKAGLTDMFVVAGALDSKAKGAGALSLQANQLPGTAAFVTGLKGLGAGSKILSLSHGSSSSSSRKALDSRMSIFEARAVSR